MISYFRRYVTINTIRSIFNYDFLFSVVKRNTEYSHRTQPDNKDVKHQYDSSSSKAKVAKPNQSY